MAPVIAPPVQNPAGGPTVGDPAFEDPATRDLGEPEILALIALSRVPGLGGRAIRPVIERYGSAAGVFAAARRRSGDECGALRIAE